MTKVILPELGQDLTSATVSFWHRKEGEKVSQNDDLVELTTDKAAFNVPAPCTGVLTEIMFQEGATANVGEVLALIDEDK